MRIRRLKLSSRLEKILINNKFFDADKLRNTPLRELFKIKGVGLGSLLEIMQALESEYVSHPDMNHYKIFANVRGFTLKNK